MWLKMGVSVDLKWTALSVIVMLEGVCTGVGIAPEVSVKPSMGEVAAGVET